MDQKVIMQIVIAVNDKLQICGYNSRLLVIIVVENCVNKANFKNERCN